MRTFNEEEKLSLLKKYLESGKSKAAYGRESGLSNANINQWLSHFGNPDIPKIVNLMEEKRIPSSVEELQDELVRLRKEKVQMEKQLRRELSEEKLRNMANTMLIDLAESTYHIRIRKNSAAK